MRGIIFCVISMFIGICLFSAHADTLPITNMAPGAQRLPATLTVYVSQNHVSRTQTPGSYQVKVPVVDYQHIQPSCYIACYRHDRGVYPVGNHLHVVGLIRVWGRYNPRVGICLPHHAKPRDLSQNAKYAQFCEMKFADCQQGACWAGGDTGGWFDFSYVKQLPKINQAQAARVRSSSSDPTADQTPIPRLYQ